MYTVLIADDEAIVRMMLSSMIVCLSDELEQMHDCTCTE